jgi:hypothetical protein
MNYYQELAISMIEKFDSIGDLTLLPNFVIRKMLVDYLVAEGLEIEQSRKIAMSLEVEVSQEAYDALGLTIVSNLVHSMAKVIAKFNAATIANGLGPIQDGQGMNLKFS